MEAKKKRSMWLDSFDSLRIQENGMLSWLIVTVSTLAYRDPETTVHHKTL
jgi:hypothetical protein